MPTTVRVTGRPFAFGGWKGQLQIDGTVLRIVGNDPGNLLEIDCADVKRYSFNSSNGLWALRMRDGRKLFVQTSGSIMSADRSPAGRDATRRIRGLLDHHGGRGFSI